MTYLSSENTPETGELGGRRLGRKSARSGGWEAQPGAWTAPLESPATGAPGRPARRLRRRDVELLLVAGRVEREREGGEREGVKNEIKTLF